ncbi:unnamed protein product [Lactuca virosa]|uniref:Orn/Lys/Arg decarboxylases family 1 pyridoxal-P attachment site domain-containing protein n=1 Tax=Lactuca virosa TaxID=75947 RepID=A0AAU9P5Y3_9ASTR|nr:unnamed protein product [Lactuca virosa]
MVSAILHLSLGYSGTTMACISEENPVGRAAPSSLSNLIGLLPFLHDLDAQKQATELFGATKTWFLVWGTTCGIQASVMATCSPGDTLILPKKLSYLSFFFHVVKRTSNKEKILLNVNSGTDTEIIYYYSSHPLKLCVCKEQLEKETSLKTEVLEKTRTVLT